MGNVYAVILAGGGGTRFWPASRRAWPKQLLPLAPDSDRSLLQLTLDRIEPLVPLNRVVIVGTEALADPIRRAIPGIDAATLLGEPQPRNTAPAIGWATARIAAEDPEARIVVLPADAWIEDAELYRQTLQRALDSVAPGATPEDVGIATIGLTPTRPDTGYGYIEVGEPIGVPANGVNVGLRFVEKPDVETAREYVAGGRHRWNSGMFIYRAEAMMRAIAAHLPELAAGLQRLTDGAEPAEVFPTLPAISIDHGVMEHLQRFPVIDGRFPWSDLGTWQAAWEAAHRDEHGNAADPSALLVGATGNLVRDLRTTPAGEGRRRVTALLDVHDLCVIETDDATLVLPRDKAQDVRRIVDALAERGDDHLL